MNGVLFFCCLLFFGCPRVAHDSSYGDNGKVSGQVLYRNGSPVQDAEVEVHYFAAGSLILPTTRTDERGYFSISAPPYGEGVVTASKVSEGYPNAAIALYGRTGYASLKRINVVQGVILEGIALRFGEPDAVIDWTIQSAVTRDPIKSARFIVSLSDDGKLFSSTSVSEVGRIVFVLPKHPVFVKVTAPGFADWVYTDEHTQGRTLLLKPGTHQQRVILLQQVQ